MSIGEIGELLRRSTVHVRSTDSGRASAGSGVIWSSSGIVVTNAHVAERGTHLVELWDGTAFTAEVTKRDPHRDLARLQIPASGLPAAQFRAAPARAGEPVIAVGNPLGFTGAISTGVVRAEGRIRGLGNRSWVQAAVRLAPGNSGGPLADAAGAVIGINTMVVSGGLALAIPTATVAEFIRNGRGPRLGVSVRPVQLARSRFGLLILEVEPGSPAEYASLLLGDVLVGTADRAFTDTADLGDALGASASGQLRLRFLRGDKTREREVVVSFPRRRPAAA